MSRCEAAVFTIGHSNHSLETFMHLVARHHVDILADVRSSPYSRFNPQFNRESLAVALQSSKIEYAYLGNELGGRPDNSSCYEDGRVRYDRVSNTKQFLSGLKQVTDAVEEHRVALMCAEKEPLDCHRTLLVAQALDSHGVTVSHILADGGLESHPDTMSRLLEEYKMDPEGDMFATREQSIALAIERRAKQVAFSLETLRTPERKNQ